MKAYLTRRYLFSASHRLHSEQMSEEENRATYGKCNNPHGHGHNYTMEITVSGLVDERTGKRINAPATLASLKVSADVDGRSVALRNNGDGTLSFDQNFQNAGAHTIAARVTSDVFDRARLDARCERRPGPRGRARRGRRCRAWCESGWRPRSRA